ncbi:MAG: 2-hydroxy-3-oxopropionate reductase [Deltaproteobacteria bacterium]|nr:2-hydroxy-3-oxopropionate reductase [Deltaproteobacteria bacterium]
MERIGFIGLGAMGKPMTRNLMKAGYPVNVLTRTQSRIGDLLADGAVWCNTPKEIAQNSEIVITMLPDTPDVEQVFSGRDGVFDGARPGMLLIDMSTVSPVAVRRLAREARVRDCDFLDAPVSGGDIGAQNGTLSIMAGGEEPAFRRAMPVFQALGKTILLIGDSGAGQIAKAANQILTSVTTEAVAEALVFAAKAGVDPAKVRQALMGGSASSRILETHGEKMIERDFKPGFRMRLHHKDLDITLDAGETYGAALPVTALVRELMTETLKDGQGDMDNSSFLLLLEKLSNRPGTGS